MLRHAAFALFIVSSTAVWADSWAPPSKQTYHAPDKSARLIVTPRDLESTLSYFNDKVGGKEPAGAPAGSKATTATAVLERRTRAGRWERAWSGQLVNQVAPVEVVVANNGQGFATFDNWHSVGYGPEAIVIYRGDGTVVRQVSLNNLFPNWFVAALPHSVSSIHWRGDPRISNDGTELIVPVVQPSKEQLSSTQQRMVDLIIRMADGAAVGLDRPEWKQALTQASAFARETCATQRQELKEWNAPISAPTTGEEQDWHHYLRETQFRTKWSDDPPFAGTTVLRSPSAPDFKPSLKWLEEALTESSAIDHDLRAVGSPDTDRLTTEIERIGAAIRPGQLKGVDLVIVADPQHADRIRLALARSGASLTIIDPAQSFPQVKQRMQGETELIVCQAPDAASRRADWWYALPFLILGGGIFLLRRT